MKTLWFYIVIYRQALTVWARGKIFDLIYRNYRSHEGYCMCGDKIEYHGMGSGHSPVDSWYYYRDKFVHGENGDGKRKLGRRGLAKRPTHTCFDENA